MKSSRFFFAAAIFLSGVAPSLSQAVQSTDIGFVPTGMYQHTDIDSVNLENGNAVIHIPLLGYPQRGHALSLSYSIVANTTMWQPVIWCNSDDSYCENAYYQPERASVSVPVGNECSPGFSPIPSVMPDQSQSWCFIIEGPAQAGCSNNGAGQTFCDYYLSTAFYVQEPTGGQHRLFFDNNNLNVLRTTDGSGYRLNITDPQAFYPYLPPTCSNCGYGLKNYSGSILIDSKGTQITGNGMLIPGLQTESQIDTNGNSIQINASNITDTVGRVIPTPPQGPTSTDVSGCPTVNAQFQSATGSATWVVPGPNGQPATYLFCFAEVLFQTNFWGYNTYNYVVPIVIDPGNDLPYSGSVDYTEGSGGGTILQSVVLPNGKSWQFVYDAADPSSSAYSVGYGNLTKIISPTGSSISYTYGFVDDCGVTDSQGESVKVQHITQRTQTDANGNVSIWKYAYPSSLVSQAYPLSAVETGPDNNDTVVSFQSTYPDGGGANCSVLPAKTIHYAGSYTQNKVLRSESTAYQTALAGLYPTDSGTVLGNAVPATITMTDEIGDQQVTAGSYDSGFTAAMVQCYLGHWAYPSAPIAPCTPQSSPVSLSLEMKTGSTTSDWGSSTVSATSIPLLSGTTTTYKWQTNSTFYTENLLSYPATETITNGYGLQEAQTTYGYDGSGNQTSISHWLNTTGGFLTTNISYDSHGMPVSVQDPNGNTTLAAYDTPADLFPSKVQQPTTGGIAHIDYYSYDDNTGNLLWHTDENGGAANDPAHTTYYTYADPLGRLTRVLDPPTQSGQGQTNNSYNDTALTVTTTVTATPSPSQTSVKAYDSLGRLSQTIAPSGATQETTYDQMGRVVSVTNPHFATQSSSDGTTTFQYDALGRKTLQINPDDTPQQPSREYWGYNGNKTTFTDESGNQWQRTYDGLGRLSQVLEPNGISTAPSMETDYGYDPLGNLLSVMQWGGPSGSSSGIPRAFNYDSLSRLVQTLNPESGWTCYGTTTLNAAPNGSNCTEGYDGNGNLTARTDARGIKTSFSYDALNRLTGKSYSDGEGPVVYGYDVSSVPFGSGIVTAVSNPVGRMAGACRLNSAQNSCITLESFSYDSMGRVAQQWSMVPSGSVYTQSFSYDVAGDPTQTVLPVPTQANSNSNLTLQYNWDNAQHLSSIKVTGQPQSNGSLWNSTTYLSNPTLLQAAAGTGYDPFGNLVRANLGITSSQSNGAATISRGYDNRGRITFETDGGMSVSTSGTQSKGSINLTGIDASGAGQAKSGSGVLTVAGFDGQQYECTTTYEWINAGDSGNVLEPVTTCDNVPDTGTLSVTIGGFTSAVSYDGSSTDAALASVLSAGFNSTSSPVKTVVSGNSITVTAIATGTASNYPISISNGDFTVSDPNNTLTGGADGGTIYDAGTVTATVTNDWVSPAVSYTTSPVSWGQGSTPSSLASSLASAINTAAGSIVTATASGSSVQVVSKTTGSATNYTISVSVADTQKATYPSLFPSASFQASATSMIGGQNAAPSYGTVYSYQVPTGGYAANGNLLSYTDSTVMGTWNFGYDTLNRLTGANSMAGAYSGLQTAWSYDAFGNRTAENFSGTTVHSVPTSSTAAFNANNRISSSSLALGGPLNYDAAGNVIYDGTNFYAYDGEGHECAVYNSLSGSLTGYDYNAEGQRVAKGKITGLPAPTIGQPLTAAQVCNLATSSNFILSAQYLLDQGGNQVTELNTTTGTMAWAHTNIWTDGALATYDINGLHFHLNDPLGTRRVQVAAGGGAAGCVENSFQSLLWGSGLTVNPGCGSVGDSTEQHFTGKERDSESGNDYFEARYYGSSMGRFMSPDPGWFSATHPENPQSWNLYSYVYDNPMIAVDPFGYDCVYLNDAGTDVDRDAHGEPTGIDQNSNRGECEGNHGYWVDGTATEVFLSPNSNDVYLKGQLDNGGATNNSYLSNTASITVDSNPNSIGTFDVVSVLIPGSQTSPLELHGHDPWPVRFFGTHWCGPGGGGVPVNALDAACKAHDKCYEQAGVSAANNTGGQQMTLQQAAAVQGCNQALYDAAKAHPYIWGSAQVRTWLKNGDKISILTGGMHNDVLAPGTRAQ